MSKNPKSQTYWVACWAKQIEFYPGDSWGEYVKGSEADYCIRTCQFNIADLEEYVATPKIANFRARDRKWELNSALSDGDDIASCVDRQCSSMFALLFADDNAEYALKATKTNSVFWCDGCQSNLVTGLGRTREVALMGLGSGISKHAADIDVALLADQPEPFIRGLPAELRAKVSQIRAVLDTLRSESAGNEIDLF